MTMEEFVTYELAVKLKEKGFREQCYATYTPYSGTLKFNEINVDKRPKSYHLSIEEFRECYNYYEENNIDAPTISQALKWLREEKKISIEIGIHSTLKWMCSIYDFSNGIRDITLYDNDGIDDTIYIFYESYELAALAAIEYVLDKII